MESELARRRADAVSDDDEPSVPYRVEWDPLLGASPAARARVEAAVAAEARATAAVAAAAAAVVNCGTTTTAGREAAHAAMAAALAQEKAAAAEAEAARAATAEAATEAQLGLLTECAVRRPDVLNVRPTDLPNTARMREVELVARHWAALARYDVPAGHKAFVAARQAEARDLKRLAESSSREVRARAIRVTRLPMKAQPSRMRRLMKEAGNFSKRWDREQVDLQKQKERQAIEQRKRDDELREAKRQQQRLNFLLTQTELYTHFMGKDTPTDTADAAAEGVAAPSNPDFAALGEGTEEHEAAAAAAKAVSFLSSIQGSIPGFDSVFRVPVCPIRQPSEALALTKPSRQTARRGLNPLPQILGIESNQGEGLPWFDSA